VRERLNMGCFPSLFLPSLFTVKEGSLFYLGISILINPGLGKKKNINQNQNVNHSNMSFLFYVSDD